MRVQSATLCAHVYAVACACERFLVSVRVLQSFFLVLVIVCAFANLYVCENLRVRSRVRAPKPSFVNFSASASACFHESVCLCLYVHA